MSIEENKAVVAAFSEALWRKRDLTAFDTYISEDYRDREIPGNPREGLKQFFAGYFAGRPDFRLTSEELIAEGDRVVQYITGEFTNTLDRYGPAGIQVAMLEINIFTIADGMIVGRDGLGRSTPSGGH